MALRIEGQTKPSVCMLLVVISSELDELCRCKKNNDGSVITNISWKTWNQWGC